MSKAIKWLAHAPPAFVFQGEILEISRNWSLFSPDRECVYSVLSGKHHAKQKSVVIILKSIQKHIGGCWVYLWSSYELRVPRGRLP